MLLQKKFLIVQSLQRLATAWVVWESNTGWVDIPFTRPNRLWVHLAFYALGTGPFAGVQLPGSGIDHLS